jgi:hypothetical protein
MTACEYNHTATGVECDGEASYMLRSHKRYRPICEAISKKVWSHMRQPCYECRRPKFTHWEIQSIHHVEATA